MVLLAFLPLEAAFHKFSTLLLITFKPTAQFRSNFFQTVCSYKAQTPKGCLSLQIVAVVHHKPKKPKFWASGIRNWVGGGTFCKIFKNCFEILHT